MAYFYIYKMTHPETGEYYIGRRKSELHPFEDSYRGSSQKWYKSISIEEVNSLIKEILFECSNFEDLCELESNLIRENIKNPLCKNGYIPGKGFYTTGPLSDAQKNKISDNGTRGKFWVNNGVESMISDEIPKGWVRGRLPIKKETKEKISKALKGRSLDISHRDSISLSLKKSEKLKNVMSSDAYKEKISKALKGREFSTEHKEKLSNAAKNRKPISEETRTKLIEARKRRTQKTKKNSDGNFID
jgi:hypothetical protein